MCRALPALSHMLSWPAEEQCHCTIQRYGLKAGGTFLVDFAYCSCRPFLMYCRCRHSVTELIPAHGGKCTRESLIPLVNALQYSGYVRMFLMNPAAFTGFSIWLRNHTCIFYAPESLFLKQWAVLWPEGHVEWAWCHELYPRRAKFNSSVNNLVHSSVSALVLKSIKYDIVINLCTKRIINPKNRSDGLGL